MKASTMCVIYLIAGLFLGIGVGFIHEFKEDTIIVEYEGPPGFQGRYHFVLYYNPDPATGFRSQLIGIDRLKARVEYQVFAYPGGTRGWSALNALRELDFTPSGEVLLHYDKIDTYVYMEVINREGEVEFWVAMDRWVPGHMLVNGVTVERDPIVDEIIELLIPYGEVGLSGHPRSGMHRNLQHGVSDQT